MGNMKKRLQTVERLRIEWKGASVGGDFDASVVKDDLLALARALGRMAARRDLAAARANAEKVARVAEDVSAADAGKAPQKVLH